MQGLPTIKSYGDLCFNKSHEAFRDLLAACKQALADLEAGHQYIRRQPDAVDATILTLEAAIAAAKGKG